MERCDTCANTFLQTLEPCACVTRMKLCQVRSERAVRRNMCVRQVSVCTLFVVHTVVATACVLNAGRNLSENLSRKKMNIPHSMTILTKIFNSSSGFGILEKILRLHHSMSALIFLAGTCSISWPFINHCEWRLLGFPRYASLRDRPS